MTSPAIQAVRHFVTFPLGAKRFALEAGRVQELVMSAQVHRFPHTTTALDGVLVRKGTAIPVCDLGSVLLGGSIPRQLYLIAKCQVEGAAHAVAIPVSGSCELLEGCMSEPDPASDDNNGPQACDARQMTFVTGLLSARGMTLPLLDLDAIVSHCMNVASRPSAVVSAGVAVAGEAGR